MGIKVGVWARAGRCDSSQCVEVAGTEDGVLVRDSKMPDGGTLRITRAQWEVFIARVENGEFDL